MKEIYERGLHKKHMKQTYERDLRNRPMKKHIERNLWKRTTKKSPPLLRTRARTRARTCWRLRQKRPTCMLCESGQLTDTYSVLGIQGFVYVCECGVCVWTCMHKQACIKDDVIPLPEHTEDRLEFLSTRKSWECNVIYEKRPTHMKRDLSKGDLRHSYHGNALSYIWQMCVEHEW